MDYWGKYTEKLTIFKVPSDAKPVLLARSRDVPPCPGFSRDPGSHVGWGLCLSTTAVETRASAMWAVQPGQEDPRKLWPPALGAPRDLGAPGLGLPTLSGTGGGLLLRCLARPTLSSCNSVARTQVPLVAQEHHANTCGLNVDACSSSVHI